jgi:flagellin
VGTRKEDAVVFKPQSFNIRADALGIESLDFSKAGSAREALDTIDGAMNKLSGSRAEIGAAQNKMASTINNLGVQKENLSSARSRIADVDVASETSQLVKSNILQQAGISILGQANQQPQAALRLLG